jgi:glycerol-3-phosphate O-acyltransferase/dihydroxyacetone phosphate acyltransferase
MRHLSRLLVRVFFRRIEVEGVDRLPVDRPTVLVANHINGLVDALLLMAMLPRFPRFLGKSTLFRIPLLWPFLKLAGVVPVYRAKDGESTARNEDSFRTCRLMLRRNSLVALFPEGISHDESMLQPLKTGAARIALGAAGDDSVSGVVIVAVGLSYDAKARFRSRALVRMGSVEDADRWVGPYRKDPHQAVRDLTAEMAEQLSAVGPTYRSWVQAEQWRRIASIAARPTGEHAAGEVDLARIEEMSQKLADREKSGRRAAEFGILHRAFAEYERDLALIGLSDEQVTDGDHPGRRRLALAWSATKVLGALPFAAVGAVVHVVPYQIMKKVGGLPRNESIRATVKVLGCFVLFSVMYVVAGVLVSEEWGPWLGLVAAAGAPACGYATVRLVERLGRIGGVMSGARVVRRRRAVVATVMIHREAVVEAVAVAIA